jgi:hypothetical protein
MTDSSEPGSGPESQRPRLGPTRPSTLVIAGLAAMAVAWLLISRFYGDFRALPWLPIAVSAALAVLEGYLAYTTRARIELRPGREPVDPLAVARFVVLAKASSLTGALFAGFYGGVLAWLLVEQARGGGTDALESDLPTAAAGVIGALALTAAALWLERACRVPPQDDEDRTGPGAGAPWPGGGADTPPTG